MTNPTSGFGTRAVHAGQDPDPVTGAIMPAIHQSSTYVQPELGRHTGYEYSRTQNPTREALERNLAALEGGTHALAFASGLAAIEAALKLLSAGDHVISEENTYGGTTRLFTHVLTRLGIEFTFVDSSRPDDIEGAVRPATKMVFLETPTNPMMKVSDLAAAARIARDNGLLLVVDNTFATPFNQRPLEHGAHIVAHSTTKYLNGHSDVIGGALVVSDEELDRKLQFLRNATGAVPGPMDAWLVLRGLKTLHLRMMAHNENGHRVAGFLSEHPDILQTWYPGLPSHPQHELARSQMSGFSGMVSVELGSAERARHFVERTRIFALAESLGGVESLIGAPALMTHASIPAEMRERLGITDGLVRLSAGIEDPDDLVDDLEQALEGLPS